MSSAGDRCIARSTVANALNASPFFVGSRVQSVSDASGGSSDSLLLTACPAPLTFAREAAAHRSDCTLAEARAFFAPARERG
jgi:hypothetical protein